MFHRDDGNYNTTLTYVVVIAIVFAAFKAIKQRRENGPLLPPGPKPLPLLGNLLDFPLKKAWVAYSKMSKQHGNIMHIEALGENLIIIDSKAVATELLDKRSQIYSDRPTAPMVELMGWDFNIGLLPYGELWRQHRRTYQQVLRKDVASVYHPMQTQKVREMLNDLLASPDKFVAHYQTLSIAIIMAAIYGHDVTPEDDEIVSIVERAVAMGTANIFPGARLVNHFPILRYLPPWFPGANFHEVATECRKLTADMKEIPFNKVRKEMADGTHQSSALSRLLEMNDAQGGSKHTEEVIKGVAATAYGAASDTTFSSMVSITLALVMFPEVQKRAQAEIDRVVGHDRLPEISDRPDLPYCEAMYREIMRWAPPLPLSVMHRNVEDDIYEGYFIQKGSIIVPNIWSMTRNEEVYTDAHQYQPERFLKPDGSLNDDNHILAYGFGRRNCVGRHMASSTIWLTTVSILATLNIRHAKDETGCDIPVSDSEWVDGMIVHPKPFPCSITPRSTKVVELVRRYKGGGSS